MGLLPPQVEATTTMATTTTTTMTSDINQYYLVKGDIDDDSTCTENSCDTKLAEESEVHAVRCCSDTQKGGWKKKTTCSVWAQIIGIWSNCKNLNWQDANAFCISQGGRLCTKDELEASCTEETGCSFDFRLIWSSTTDTVEV